MTRYAVLLAALALALPAAGQTFDTRPAKPEPEPAVAYLGQCIAVGEPLPAFPADLVMDDGKCDGRPMWVVKRVGTCMFCGQPMTWKQAAFDKKQSSLWITFAAMGVADTELSKRSPCVVARTCREFNPLVRLPRPETYAVQGVLTGLFWLTEAWERKGYREYHIGGNKLWWVPGIVGIGAHAVGIIDSAVMWNRHF